MNPLIVKCDKRWPIQLRLAERHQGVPTFVKQLYCLTLRLP